MPLCFLCTINAYCYAYLHLGCKLESLNFRVQKYFCGVLLQEQSACQMQMHVLSPNFPALMLWCAFSELNTRVYAIIVRKPLPIEYDGSLSLEFCL
jgi:hypothetical protein